MAKLRGLPGWSCGLREGVQSHPTATEAGQQTLDLTLLQSPIPCWCFLLGKPKPTGGPAGGGGSRSKGQAEGTQHTASFSPPLTPSHSPGPAQTPPPRATSLLKQPPGFSASRRPYYLDILSPFPDTFMSPNGSQTSYGQDFFSGSSRVNIRGSGTIPR